ncbi:hypothetical protein DFH07DRAFT_963896 [Mycena maculata]|uniref:DUF6533 domain-containing protein n=1 Tax=Mycena maculata TaxID=230809 RepID=A0AAD7IL75_9AGAR|nr:hypothetical protein DFH07DRAFT_963896 [Mycena maculata]
MATVELDLITVYQDQRLRRSLFLAGFVVVLFDHLLTLSSEVKNIWSPRFKRSSAWFLLFRYVTLLSNLTMVAFFLGNIDTEEFFVGCTLSLRVCAMYGFNRRVFISLSIAALTTVSLGAWAIVGPHITLETSVPGCHTITSKDQAMRKSPCVALAWEAQLVCDILILSLTLRRASTYHRAVGLRSPSLLRTMFRDGAVYFGMICLVNLANIVMIYVTQETSVYLSFPPLCTPIHPQIITAGSLAWFACSISVTMISRLMLNLHDTANRQFDVLGGDSELEPIQFRYTDRL